MMIKLPFKLLFGFICFLIPVLTFAQAPNLGVASDFALFTGAGQFEVTGAATVVTGDVGTNVGAFNAFPPGTLIGSEHVADPVSANAATDVNLAYMDLDGRTCGQVIGNTTLGNGQTLTPDVYCLGAAASLNGDLILDGECDPDAFFLIQIDGALSTTANSRVILTNGASLCNVFWQINGAVNLGPNSAFRGTILANGAINMAFDASLFGRGLTRAGAISLTTNIVTIQSSALEIMCPPDMVLDCSSGTDTAITGVATVMDMTDNCGMDSIRFEDMVVAGACANEDTTFRMWIAVDRCGNEDTCTQVITRTDTEPPTLVSCPSPSVIDCSTGDPLSIGMPEFTDNCSSSGNIVVTTRIDSTGFDTGSEDARIINVKFFATDECGNVDSSCTQIFICQLEEEECPTVNCYGNVNLDLGPGCELEITPNMILSQPLNPALWPYCEITLENEFGGIIANNTLGINDVGKTFDVVIRCQLPGCPPRECSTTITVGAGNCTLSLTSDLQPGDEPNISEGKINVYEGNIPTPSDHIPMATNPYSGRTYTPNVQPDWVMPVPRDEISDTAEVIFRTWEVFDKEGDLYTLTDTIVVFRLPKLTPGAFVGTPEDSFYCDLEAVSNERVGLKRYVSWKQPVGLHDYELPYSKLRGVTYEIPSTIIAAGLINAYAQGIEVFREYLNCVILRKADGTEWTIGEIVFPRGTEIEDDGTIIFPPGLVFSPYIQHLINTSNDQQKLYGFLQLLIEGNENPIKVFIETFVLNFYPYLLLEKGDWILSEGGNFEQVDEDWFYNGNGNSPYWFSGGWPSIYGNGDCISYCDVGAEAPGAPRGGCIEIQVPLLDTLGLNPELCDTICLPTGVHCGITIKQDPPEADKSLTDWTGSTPGRGTACPQTRGVDSWITQTCWAETFNHCAGDIDEDNDCTDLSADDNEDDAVVDYECNDKAVKIHLSQWQTLYDTIGPIFDFCYPTDGNIRGCEGFQDDIVWLWDTEQIQIAIRDGRQYGGARAWESCNPTTYRVGTHDCIAEIYVPSVKVIDNCSGVNSVKAMMDVAGGTRAVALERTETETQILSNGDTCYIHTYSHTADPIKVPFSGCNGELTEVRYEAADVCWNQSTWTKFIKITDDVPPTVVMDRAVTVPLQNKIAWVHAEAFDEGSWDNCAIDLRLARRTDWLWTPKSNGSGTKAAGVDLCPNGKEYDNWVDLLDDIGIDRDDAVAAVGGVYVGSDFVDNLNDLSTFLNDGEVEEYYLNQILWLWEDSAKGGQAGPLCSEKVVHAWLYAIASYIAENCSVADEHGNVLDVKDLEAIFDYLSGYPGYGNELSLLGGGWGKSVPFKCEDACEEVTVELVVFDYCCNWGKGWATVHVEDKGNARLVKRLPDLDISCEAYNIFYKDVVENAASLGENGSENDNSGVFADLDSVFGHYVKTWVDVLPLTPSEGGQIRATDIDGNLLPDSVLNFDYWNITCEEKSETEKIAVERHDGTIDWVTEVHKTTYLDTAVLSGMNGIIGINCAASCTQDVWVDLDECGQGTITRRFFVKGGCGPKAPEWEIEQVINVKSACGLRESMFDLPAHVGSKTEPICLPEGLAVETHDRVSLLPDTIGAVTLKPHLDGALCNSIAIGSEIKELDVLGATGMTKYIITWTVIDWCAPHTSTNREFTYTQEVIATIDPYCDVSTGADTIGDASLISGHIMTELEMAVKGVNVKAVLGQGSPLSVETPGSGDFSFSIQNGSQVSILPGKNTDFSNGVSTADLIDIQRHILQKKSLDSKYKRIAADVNGNGRIDGLDVLELRQLVLNPRRVFANNTSWRFYESETGKEVYEINPLEKDMTVNFTGVKIGDVNLSGDKARRSLSGVEVSSRSKEGQLHLNIADKTLKGGDVYRLDVTSDNFANINGMQYTLSYGTNLVEVESIEAGALNITADNYVRYAPGVITSSWSEAEGQNLSSEVVLFTLVLKAKSEVQLRDALSLNSRITTTEAYDAAGGLKDVSLRFERSRLKDGTEFALYQNTPNPYKGETVIGFKLPTATSATMTVYDVTGRMIKRIDGDYDAGYNEVRVTSRELGTTGVLYYQLDTDDYTATKKMILIN